MFPKIKISGSVLATILMLVFAGLAVLAFRAYCDMKADRDRLRENQNLLLHNGVVEITQTNAGRSHASTPAITLRPEEFRKSGDTLAKVSRQVDIKPSRISGAATAATSTRADIEAPLTSVQADELTSEPVDSQATRPPVHPSTRCFSWHDPWLSLSGCVSDSVFRGTVSATDTLDIIVHRVPKRFLFFRFGCREVRMDIISRNPHTRLTYARYYRLIK
ncbi:histidine kinase [Prevotella sp. oral taxon 376]|uniref:DUF6549 family protein n=1 Tax=Prevotella sp. oral taxon 376 TaxID=712466 RepID=UPI000D1ECE8E|nr:DUF6549 family protein [Prevotella sp. oral taxon 376]PTL32413.1 histidine kinase [Prevotella sp. oral taxon 376]